MKAQHLARSLVQHTSAPSSLFFSAASSRAANHRAWLTASSLRSPYRNLSKSHSRRPVEEPAEEAASESDTAEPVASFIHRTPTQPSTTDEPFDPNSNREPIIPPPAPSEAQPIWGAPQKARRRQISAHNAQIASLMGSTGRGANRGPRTLPGADSTELYESLNRPLTLTAKNQSAIAEVMERTLQMGIHERTEPQPPLRVDPFMGRAAVVNRTTQPLGRALMALNAALRQNQIRDQVRMQRFHERPGMRRKRLKSQRWRKRFMVGFKHMVAKVQKMKAQGW